MYYEKENNSYSEKWEEINLKRKWFFLFLCLGLFIFFPGCKNIAEINEDHSIDLFNNSNIEDLDTVIDIFTYYDMPEFISDKDMIILGGVSSGEYIEFIVKGEIFNFEHIKLDWDNKKNNLIEKEVLNSIEFLSNQTIIINTFMPEGIPLEKIKWQSKDEKFYEFLIKEYNCEGNKNKYIIEKYNF